MASGEEEGPGLDDWLASKSRSRAVAANVLRHRHALVAAAMHYRAIFEGPATAQDCCRAGEAAVFQGLAEILADAADVRSPWFEPPGTGTAELLSEGGGDWVASLPPVLDQAWVAQPDCSRCNFLSGLRLGVSLAAHDSAAELELARGQARRLQLNATAVRPSAARELIRYVIEERWAGDPPTRTRQIMDRVREIGEEGIDGSSLVLEDGRWSGKARVRIGSRLVTAGAAGLEKQARKFLDERCS